MLYTVRRVLTPANALTDDPFPLFKVGVPTVLWRCSAHIPTAFNGTTPTFDFSVDGAASGLLLQYNTPYDLTDADALDANTLVRVEGNEVMGFDEGDNAAVLDAGAIVGVISQDGTAGGGLTGSTVGLCAVTFVLSAA